MIDKEGKEVTKNHIIRKNGFTCPPTVQQILFVIIILGLGCEFYLITIIAIRDNNSLLISFIFIYSLLFTSLILAVIVSSAINPTADSKFEIP